MGGGGGGGGIGNKPILYIGKSELREPLEKRAAAAAACCCNSEGGILELLFVTGGVDDEGVGGLSGVDDRERRDIGERERDLDKPDDDDFVDDGDGDRLKDRFVLREFEDVEEAKLAFAMSGRGAGREALTDNVLKIFERFEEKN